jgi:hypothetical protein
LFLRYDPALIYGRTKVQQVEPFRPHFVVYDKKTLKFEGFFRQHVPESRLEQSRVRYVNIFYYLEDDTITVIEPTIKVNSKIFILSISFIHNNFHSWFFIRIAVSSKEEL